MQRRDFFGMKTLFKNWWFAVAATVVISPLLIVALFAWVYVLAFVLHSR